MIKKTMTTINAENKQTKQTKQKKTSSMISKTTSIIAIIVLMLMLAAAVLPNIFGFKIFYVATNSMENTIMKGSMIVLENVSFEEIQNGDILTFEGEEKNERFTHRVVEINEQYRYFITKGDANSTNDARPTAYDYVVGRVKYVVPLVGYISMFLATLYGKIIIAAIYIFWIAFEIESFRAKREKAEVAL